ncbi:MAG: dTDP-D-glucose 4,6-dehydratase [Parcubacteria group bacterium GW2011_GWF2_40_10]|nr:MAG: dTDP-D-glucose 4,6-dehydratase [Parcubacteria group bacterium GW2011_GWF2_40_10]
MMKNKILITGGAGFIGVNSARRFLNSGWDVHILDNFSRKGTDLNIEKLKNEYPTSKLKIIKADIVKDYLVLCAAVSQVDVVLHLAAQVAVTTSVANPRHDFETNALGSFNVLEAVRLSGNKPIVLYSSTNKVYGCLEYLPVKELDKHYQFNDEEIHRYGIHENINLDYHSPYGCSKGIADQYFIDYNRIYGLKTVVFRQSCVYGPFQFGIEDQGWVAWFTIASMLERGINIYGTGKQVRDLLFVDDLSRLYELAIGNINKVSGKAYNIGGGPENKLSLLQFLDKLMSHIGREIPLTYSEMRSGDQPIFIADTRKAFKDMGWKPEYDFDTGFDTMVEWITGNKNIFKKFFSY